MELYLCNCIALRLSTQYVEILYDLFIKSKLEKKKKILILNVPVVFGGCSNVCEFSIYLKHCMDFPCYDCGITEHIWG